MKKIDWDSVQETTGWRLPPDGYVCKITKVTDVPEKEYLQLEYDIASGPYQGYFQDLMGLKGFWGGKFVKSYKEKARPFFKGMLTAFAGSNPNFSFDQDETYLEGKRIGLVLGEEEYLAKDGSVKTRLYVDACRNTAEIQAGNFIVPERKKWKLKDAGFSPVDAAMDDDLPF